MLVAIDSLLFSLLDTLLNTLIFLLIIFLLLVCDTGDLFVLVNQNLQFSCQTGQNRPLHSALFTRQRFGGDDLIWSIWAAAGCSPVRRSYHVTKGEERCSGSSNVSSVDVFSYQRTIHFIVLFFSVRPTGRSIAYSILSFSSWQRFDLSKSGPLSSLVSVPSAFFFSCSFTSLLRAIDFFSLPVCCSMCLCFWSACIVGGFERSAADRYCIQNYIFIDCQDMLWHDINFKMVRLILAPICRTSVFPSCSH